MIDAPPVPEPWLTDAADIVVFDLEWTSWSGFMESRWSLPGKHREIIQFGAVRLDGRAGLLETACFERLVRPVIHPHLSDFIVDLTGITQAEVDAHGIVFADAVDAFAAFCDGADAICANGGDGRVIVENCDLADIECPVILRDCRDISAMLSESLGRPGEHIVSSDLVALLGLEHEGAAHQGLSDARAIAAALRKLVGGR